MSEEEKQIMNKMIYCNLVSGEQVIKFNNHIKEILQENEQLKDQLQQKENIIKEVREYIKQTGQYLEDIKRFKVDVLEPDYLNLLEILDKGSDEISK